MRGVVKLWVAGALFGGLTACGTADPTAMDDLDLWRHDYPAVRAMAPQGPAFHQGLRSGYIGYSDVEYAGYDYGDSVHFARKAVASAKGMRVLPDRVESRAIPAEHREEMHDARRRLMAALAATARRTQPVAAANAQTAFDCWLERQEENARPDAIAECRDAFYAALEQIEGPMVEADAVRIVFFAFDRADITPVARATIDAVIEDWRAERSVRLVLAGHADRAGPADYNMALSERRARAVADVLLRGGVPREALDIQWFGETMNRVPTADGVREPENRRVEITFE